MNEFPIIDEKSKNIRIGDIKLLINLWKYILNIFIDFFIINLIQIPVSSPHLFVS